MATAPKSPLCVPKRTIRSLVAFGLIACGVVTIAPSEMVYADAAAIVIAPGCLTNSVPRNDDGSSPLVALPFNLNFFGVSYDSLYVNNNGNVTFDEPQSDYTPYTIDSDVPPIIAPFFADVDTRALASSLVTYGDITFEGRPAFCVNWVNVGYYSSHADLLNSFQLILKDTSDVGGDGDFESIFNYGTINWETGDASGGTGGLGGTSAGAGYSAGNGTVGSFFQLPGSLVNGALLNSGPNALSSNSNVGVPGRYRYGVRFTGLVPERLLDTRPAPDGPIGVPAAGPLGAGQSLTLDVTGRAGIPPTGVGAVVLNLTYTGATLPTFLTVYPTGTNRPNASSANPVPGTTRANLVLAMVGSDGTIQIYNENGSVEVIADAQGWYPIGSSYQPLVPSRILETRGAPYATIGVPLAGPVGPGQTIDVPATGVGGVPASGVGAVVLNLTGTNPTQDTFITVFPTGATRPTASNLNLARGQTAPNLVIAPIGAGGKISLYNPLGSVDLIIDVLGWLPDNSSYTGLTPSRILDTRPPPYGPIGIATAGPVGPAQSVNLTVLNVGGVPATGVGAVVLNVTATEPTANTFVTVFPTGGGLPTASNLNPAAGTTTPNLVIVSPGANGQVTLYNAAGSAHLVVDVLGWFPG